MYLPEEPLKVISSSDLQFMVITFTNRYVVYRLTKDENGKESLKQENMYYYSIIDGIIYEDFIFIFFTDKGFYFHILGSGFEEENNFIKSIKETLLPVKLLKLSDQFNFYNLKIGKKLKDKSLTKSFLPKKIIGIFNFNFISFCDSFNEISVKEIDHILFKIIANLKIKNLKALKELLEVLEQKYILSVLIIIEHYFGVNEEILRKVFDSEETVFKFELFKFYDFFLEDLVKYSTNKGRADVILRKKLAEDIESKNTESIKKELSFASKNEL